MVERIAPDIVLRLVAALEGGRPEGRNDLALLRAQQWFEHQVHACGDVRIRRCCPDSIQPSTQLPEQGFAPFALLLSLRRSPGGLWIRVRCSRPGRTDQECAS